MKKLLLLAGLLLIMMMALASCEPICWFGVHKPDDNWYVQREPTCSAEGYEAVRCQKCGQIAKTRSITKLPHAPKDWEVSVEPTCSAEGRKEKRCADCDALVDAETIPTTEHTPEEKWTVILQETCFAYGKEVQKCKDCAEILQTQSIPAHHTPAVVPEKLPTCISTGLTQGNACQGCGLIYTEQEEIEKLPHVYVTVEQVNPTCSTYGSTEGSRCVNGCNDWLVEPEQIEKLPHTPTIDNAVAATCTKPGKSEGSHCTVCNEIIVAQKTIKKLGHDFSVFNNVCSRCPEKEYPELRTRNEVMEYNENYDAVVYLDYFIDVANTSTCWFFEPKENTKYLRFVGTPGVVYNLRIDIQKNRTQPIKIDLVNVKMQTLQQYPIIRSESTVDVEIGFYGSSVEIIGRKGDDGANGNAFSQDAKNGSKGNIGIQTNGDLTLRVAATTVKITGGNGGNGGNGGEMFGNHGGDGGNGGNGAYAISANSITVKYESGYNKNNLLVSGGNGGNGGRGGEGSGFLYNDGRDGSKGQNSVATNVPIQ